MRALRGFRKLSRGVVLAEFAMTCVIGGMVLSVLPAFYLASTKVWQRETGEIGAREEADLAIVRMKKELRNARSTSISSDGLSMTLVLPALSGSRLSTETKPLFNSEGQLINGDQVRYYYQAQPGSAGGTVFRQVTHSNGTSEAPRMVADHIYPGLNPLASGVTVAPFRYDSTKRTVTVTLTAAGMHPSSTTFETQQRDPICTKHRIALTRVVTDGHPEGVVRCRECGTQTLASASVATYKATLLLRNR
ncbi:MAG: hypothetical protein ACE149_10870 [Armatimonadota bacterium]